MHYFTKDFALYEFEQSATARRLGIDNSAPEDVRGRLGELCRKVLQPLRDEWGRPMRINSGYRCPALNATVGGVETSQHCKGEAADIAASDPIRFARYVRQSDVWSEIDQMGIYGDFVHLSHKAEGEQRGQIFYGKSYKGDRL